MGFLQTLGRPFAKLASWFYQAPQPERRQGVGGFNAVGGFLVSNETSPDLSYGPTRFKTLQNMLLNTAIVGAGTRYYLQMITGPGWTVSPPEDGGDEAQRIADLVDDIIHDMEVPWYRVVRGAALFKLMGFSVQEWIAKNRDDGVIGFESIERRPQHTIEQWDFDDNSAVVGWGQRVPHSGQLLYLPRAKCIYIVDDSLTDSPDGVGLLRHCVETNRQLKRFEQLEGWGYETDARGIPLGRAPIGYLDQMVKNGHISQAEADARVKAIKSIVRSHTKNPGLGLYIDSAVYTDQSPSLSPSGTAMYGLELLRGDGAGLSEINEAIKRKNLEIARTLGVEHLLLGGDGKGSLALSHDKTDAFAQLLQSALQELAESFRKDVVGPLFDMNGWDRRLMPELKPDAVQLSSISEIMDALTKMAQSGSYMPPDDPVWNQIRDMLHLVEQPQLPPNVAGVLGASPANAPDDPGKKPGGKAPPEGATDARPNTGGQDDEVDELDENDVEDEEDEVDEQDEVDDGPPPKPSPRAARDAPDVSEVDLDEETEKRRVAKYDPDQKRDDGGRWTHGGPTSLRELPSIRTDEVGRKSMRLGGTALYTADAHRDASKRDITDAGAHRAFDAHPNSGKLDRDAFVEGWRKERLKLLEERGQLKPQRPEPTDPRFRQVAKPIELSPPKYKRPFRAPMGETPRHSPLEDKDMRRARGLPPIETPRPSWARKPNKRRVDKGNPNQPRDSHGRWEDQGGSPGDTSASEFARRAMGHAGKSSSDEADHMEVMADKLEQRGRGRDAFEANNLRAYARTHRKIDAKVGEYFNQWGSTGVTVGQAADHAGVGSHDGVKRSLDRMVAGGKAEVDTLTGHYRTPRKKKPRKG